MPTTAVSRWPNGIEHDLGAARAGLAHETARSRLVDISGGGMPASPRTRPGPNVTFSAKADEGTASTDGVVGGLGARRDQRRALRMDSDMVGAGALSRAITARGASEAIARRVHPSTEVVPVR